MTTPKKCRFPFCLKSVTWSRRATITGINPETMPSLSGDRAEFDRTVNEVGGAKNPNVFVNQPLAQVLQVKTIAADFTYAKPQTDTEMLYVHRHLPDQHIYWVNNRKDRVEDIEAGFRVTGKAPELWYPET